jgi:hypothetical protein
LTDQTDPTQTPPPATDAPPSDGSSTTPTAPAFTIDYTQPLIAHAVIELQKANVDEATTLNYLFAIQGFVNLQLNETAIQQITVLLNNENLTPLTSDPSEWTQISDNLWESTRNDKAFSQDGGKTYNYLPVADRVDTVTYAAPAS